MKYVLAVVWLGVAVLGYRVAGLRKLFAYAGSVLAMVHLCALVVGLAGQKLRPAPADAGPPVGGFFVGIVIGLALGVLLGGPAARNTTLYWGVQLAAAGFLAFLPLYRI